MLLELHDILYEMRAMLYLSRRWCLTHDTWPFYFLLDLSAIICLLKFIDELNLVASRIFAWQRI
jgi:hypothetical protein